MPKKKPDYKKIAEKEAELGIGDISEEQQELANEFCRAEHYWVRHELSSGITYDKCTRCGLRTEIL